jgi:hypothetical protein
MPSVLRLIEIGCAGGLSKTAKPSAVQCRESTKPLLGHATTADIYFPAPFDVNPGLLPVGLIG